MAFSYSAHNTLAWSAGPLGDFFMKTFLHVVNLVNDQFVSRANKMTVTYYGFENGFKIHISDCPFLVAGTDRCYLSFSTLQLQNLIWFSGDNNFTFNMLDYNCGHYNNSKEFFNLPFYHFSHSVPDQ